jgi:lipopolysaccharide export system permease protein
MSRLARYLLRESAGLYALGVAAFCLLLSIDFLTVWARFLLEQNATLATVGRLMLYQLPWFLHLSLPIAVVFAVLLATGRLAKDSELKAAYALGVRPSSLLGPLLGFGLLVSALSLVNNGFLEPLGKVAYDRLVASFFYERPPAAAQSEVAYFIAGQGIYYAGRIRAKDDNPEQAALTGLLILREDGSLISAPRGLWDSQARQWRLESVTELANGTLTRHAELILPFVTQSPAAALARSETLTLSQLWQLYQDGLRSGADTRRPLFEFHRRVADAFSALVFALIAGVLGLNLRGRSAGFAWTIILLVLFYFIWTLSGDLFEQRVLSPVAAAWFTSGAVGAVGALLAWWRLR